MGAAPTLGTPSGCFPGSPTRPKWGEGSSPWKAQLSSRMSRCRPGLRCVFSAPFILDVLLEGPGSLNALVALRRERKTGRGVQLLSTDACLSPLSLAQRRRQAADGDGQAGPGLSVRLPRRCAL